MIRSPHIESRTNSVVAILGEPTGCGAWFGYILTVTLNSRKQALYTKISAEMVASALHLTQSLVIRYLYGAFCVGEAEFMSAHGLLRCSIRSNLCPLGYSGYFRYRGPAYMVTEVQLHHGGFRSQSIRYCRNPDSFPVRSVLVPQAHCHS